MAKKSDFLEKRMVFRQVNIDDVDLPESSIEKKKLEGLITEQEIMRMRDESQGKVDDAQSKMTTSILRYGGATGSIVGAASLNPIAGVAAGLGAGTAIAGFERLGFQEKEIKKAIDSVKNTHVSRMERIRQTFDHRVHWLSDSTVAVLKKDEERQFVLEQSIKTIEQKRAVVEAEKEAIGKIKEKWRHRMADFVTKGKAGKTEKSKVAEQISDMNKQIALLEKVKTKTNEKIKGSHEVLGEKLKTSEEMSEFISSKLGIIDSKEIISMVKTPDGMRELKNMINTAELENPNIKTALIKMADQMTKGEGKKSTDYVEHENSLQSRREKQEGMDANRKKAQEIFTYIQDGELVKGEIYDFRVDTSITMMGTWNPKEWKVLDIIAGGSRVVFKNLNGQKITLDLQDGMIYSSEKGDQPIAPLRAIQKIKHKNTSPNISSESIPVDTQDTHASEQDPQREKFSIDNPDEDIKEILESFQKNISDFNSDSLTRESWNEMLEDIVGINTSTNFSGGYVVGIIPENSSVSSSSPQLLIIQDANNNIFFDIVNSNEEEVEMSDEFFSGNLKKRIESFGSLNTHFYDEQEIEEGKENEQQGNDTVLHENNEKSAGLSSSYANVDFGTNSKTEIEDSPQDNGILNGQNSD